MASVSYHGLIHDAAILLIPIVLAMQYICFEHRFFESRPDQTMTWLIVATLELPTLALVAPLPYCLVAIPTVGLWLCYLKRRFPSDGNFV
jgi:hypothetical protein